MTKATPRDDATLTPLSQCTIQEMLERAREEYNRRDREICEALENAHY